MTFGVGDPFANLVLLLDVGVNSLWGEIIFSDNERGEPSTENCEQGV